MSRTSSLVMAAAAIVALTSQTFAQPSSEPSRNPITIQTRQLAAPAGQEAAAALLGKARARGQVRVIVGLDVTMRDEDELSAAQAASQVRALQGVQDAVARRGAIAANGIVKFETIPFMSAFVTPAQLRRLLGDPQVVSIQEDVPARPQLAQSVPLIRANRVWQRGFTGAGQVVAIVDTGSDDKHPMLRNKLVAALCRSTDSPVNSSQSVCPGGVAASNNIKSGRPCAEEVDGCFHGTHVASIAVGKTAALKGVARDADFIAAQVFSRFNDTLGQGFCAPFPPPCALSYSTDQVLALERIYQLRNQFSIASVNMSLGGGKFAAFCDASDLSRSAIINKLLRARIATAIASGNDGFDGFVNAPGCIKNAVTVGSTTKADAISVFSNHADIVDILAPGSSINAALPGNTYGFLSGTSMATPHVAGAFALFKQAYPNGAINNIKKAMQKSGPKLTRKGVTKRRADLKKAHDNLIADPP